MRLNDPFDYLPCDLVLEGQRLIFGWLDVLKGEDEGIAAELSQGKMFGVMVVRDRGGEVGFLAAFSGCMDGRLNLRRFVPPIFGREDRNPIFIDGSVEIAALGREIAAITSSDGYIAAVARYEELKCTIEIEIEELKASYSEAKQRRELRRKEGEELVLLQRESQYQKGEMKRRIAALRSQLAEAEGVVSNISEQITSLKERRRRLSYELQKRMFESYLLVNGEGEWRSLYSIFDEANGNLPPSGAGECAAPKLLQYALQNSFVPMAMGEFWYGAAPTGEVRHHGQFYGACRSRCLPILKFMLRGVDVAAPDPKLIREAEEPLSLIFEDDYIAIFNKPSGMLSVPGYSCRSSVKSIFQERYPLATGPMIVHRLDQDTSGVMVVTKRADVHKAIQRQFGERTLTKRYIAIVGRVIDVDRGEISLPLSPNIDDRPRQKVDFERGKSATTTFEVLERGSDTTRLALYPHSGRTHQLRVHCAHRDGLSAPIVGDRLYGDGCRGEERLKLHAESITFTHPITGEEMTFTSTARF